MEADDTEVSSGAGAFQFGGIGEAVRDRQEFAVVCLQTLHRAHRERQRVLVAVLLQLLRTGNQHAPPAVRASVDRQLRTIAQHHVGLLELLGDEHSEMHENGVPTTYFDLQMGAVSQLVIRPLTTTFVELPVLYLLA